ncbi:MAG: FkbM family methyltransferase [Planctomycetota bacterium]
MVDLRWLWRARKFRRHWCRSEIEAMRLVLHRGQVAIDIGAHKGGWTYWMRKAVGPSGQVLAFEPQNELATALRGWMPRGWTNVEVLNACAGDHEGQIELFLPGTGSPAASTVRAVAAAEPGGAEAQARQVPLRTLDAEVRRRGWSQVHFLKVDVEGAEAAVLRGAAETIEASRPTLLIECEQRHLTSQGSTVAEVFAPLLAMGYRAWFFADGRQIPFKEFQVSVHQSSEGERFWDLPGYANNFLLVP